MISLTFFALFDNEVHFDFVGSQFTVKNRILIEENN